MSASSEVVGYPHYLKDITDPRGVRVSRSEYDPQGRLVALIDADGRRMEFTHAIDARTERVKNRRGYETVYQYDDNGWVLTETNALNQTTTRTYDENGNELSATDPRNVTTMRTYDIRGNVLTEKDGLSRTTTMTYDASNQLLTQVDPSGRTVVTNTYNDLAKTLLTTTDASGATTRFSYDTGIGSTSTGELKSMTDAVGRRTAYYVHMVFGWRTDEVDPQGVHTRYTHDTVGRVKTQVVTPDATKPNETRTTSYVYDDKGRLTSTTHPDLTTTTTTYNAIDKPATECDAINRCTTYTYDNAGHLQSTSYPDGTSESKTYDANGNVETETDRAGRTTRYVYDELDRLKTTILPDGTPSPDDNPFTEQTYDAAGRLHQVSNERGHTTTYGYDDAGRQTSVTNALNQTTTTVYDVAGRRTSVTDALNRTTKFVYDEAGRLTETIAPDETPWTDSDNPRSWSAYDALGRKTRETDGEGRITRYRYGIGGQLDMVVLPNPATGANPELVNGESPANAGTLITRYEYDTLGHKRRQIDALNRTTSWTYDESGRVLTRTLPLLQQESFVYDTLGRRTQHVDFRGRTTSYAYKPNTDLLQTIDYATDTDTTIAYTAEGQIDTVQDGNGTTSYEYGDRGQLEKVTWPSGLWIEYGYDDAGNRTRLTTADQSVSYTFDELNRLKTVTPTLGQGATYDYDAVGNRKEVVHANGVTTTYTYHPGNQLRTLTTTRPGNVQEYVLAYRIDKSGLRTQVAQLQDTFTRATYDYEYDKVKRLTGENVFLPAGRSRTVNWTYDKVGNRLTEARTGVRTANSAYSYDANDRLTQHTTSGTAPDVGTTTYQYDNAGNLTQKTSPEGTENYVYDDANRMVELIAANQEVTRYAYNHNGIRIKQTRDATGSSPQTAHYLVDPNQAYAQVVEEHAQTGSNPKTLAALYTFGDDRISQYRPANGATPATVRHYHADGLGSTRLLTDSAGVVTDRYYYEAFGELEAAASQVTSDNDFLYTGEQLDPNSEFYYLRARYMDPNAARFTSRDPAAGIASRPFSLNAHIYGENDPSNRFDPSGRMSTMSALATASAVAGVITALATSPHSPFRSKGSQRGENFVGTLNLSDSEQQSVGDALCACVEERYNPFDQEGMEIVRDISEFGAIPIYKPWMGVPVLGGASRFTNFINAFGFFTLRKTNFRLPFRLAGTVRPYTLVGRGNVVVATGFFAYDMTSIGLCVTDHLFGE